ncbi:MAG: hypothetical protein IKN75_06930 [Prevotella sp.]|nr:hypothetical protein [Prevotella sp.]
MKKKNLLIILCWFPFLVFAKSDLSKQEKSIVKELKKQYKLEAVEIKRPYEGYVYYSLLSKDLKSMIADSTGQVIIPQSRQVSDAYPNGIRFSNGHSKGYSSFREKGRNSRTITAYYPGNKPIFVAFKSKGDNNNEYKFFSTSGEQVTSFDGFLIEDFNSPVYLSKDEFGNYGLMAMDGRILLPNDYTAIETRADGICRLYQMNDGMERMGGACISDITETNVPCIFSYVNYSQAEGCWLVQIHEYDSIQVYSENNQYDTNFLDEGQRLFEKRQYGDARKYYVLNGSEAKWAQFYIGATYYKSIVERFQKMNSGMDVLKRSCNRQDKNIASEIRDNFDLFSEEARKAEEAFNAYLEINHEKYAANAKEMLYELNEMKSQTDDIERRLNMALSELERRCMELELKEREEHRRFIEQERLRLERQRLLEERLAREQRERVIQERQAEKERQQREAKRREEEKKKIQQKQPSQSTTSQSKKAEPQKKQEDKKFTLPININKNALIQKFQNK